ncbi:siderophore-interacting protein [Undibacterium sp. Di27W]|uniref:siderophore-interacting protein n=1 Tax=Undibacterium sp. Di27W TaxID=3413036 RepID=UPI003BF3DFE4
MNIHRPPLVRGMATVIDTQRITPKMQRITLDVSALEGLRIEIPAHAMKLFFTVPGQEDVEGRAYTVRHYHAESSTMSIDFILHGSGIAATWASEVQPGAQIEIGGPRAGYHYQAESAWQLFVGDATAIPAILSAIESLPAGVKVMAFMEIENEAEQQSYHAIADVSVIWVYRQDESINSGKHLLQALREAEFPAGLAQVFIGAESMLTKRIRQHLREEPRISMGNVHATGYWKMGETDYHDHQ